MMGKRIRRAVFNMSVRYLECIMDELFIVSMDVLHILNMHGAMIEDPRLPPGSVEEIFRFRDLVFVRMNGSEYHYFRLGCTEVERVKCPARVMKAGRNLMSSDGNVLSVLDPCTFESKCSVAMPEDVVDFAEVDSGVYVLLRSHLCFVCGPLCSDRETSVRPLEWLSHLPFTSARSNGRDVLVLETHEDLVVCGGSTSPWLVKKPQGYRRHKISSSFLTVLSSAVELYNLSDGKRFGRFCIWAEFVSCDENRRKLWIYAQELYEVDITTPLEQQNTPPQA